MPSAATFSAGLSSNYTITYANGTLTVNPAALTITANNATKTYGQTATFAATAFTISGLVNGDMVSSVTETSTRRRADGSGGTDPIVPGAATLSAGLSSNYTITYISGTLTVNPAALAITANNASKTYGQTASFAGTAFTTTGLVNGDTVGSVTETSTGSGRRRRSGPTQSCPAAATFSAGLSSNYTITYDDGTLTINPAALAITVSATTKPSVYGQSVTLHRDGGGQPAGLGYAQRHRAVEVDGTNFGSRRDPGRPHCVTSAPSPLVGRVARDPGQLQRRCQLHAGTGTLALTVNPAALAITASNASKTYGQTATFAGTAFTTSGLVDGDTVSSVTETSTGAAATAAVGTDPIVPSAATFSSGLSSNYTITYANGTLTINPAALAITAERRDQDLWPDGILPRDRVHGQRPGERRHGQRA